MSSTANVQSYLPYVFRPVFLYSNGGFTTTFNISNIDTLSVGTAAIARLAIGDSNQNVYVGTNSGNQPSLAIACNTYSNTALGISAAVGLANAYTSEFIGYLAGNGSCNVSNVFAAGTNAGSLGLSNTNCVFVGSSNSMRLSNVSNAVSVGANATATSESVILGTWSGSNTGRSAVILGTGTGYFAGSSNVLIGPYLSPTFSNNFTASVTSNLVTCTLTSGTVAFTPGQTVTIAGLTPITYNGTVTVVSATSSTFTYSNTSGTAFTDNIGSVTGGLPSFSYLWNNNGTGCNVTCNISSNLSNKFFVGSGSNVLMAGDFTSGLVSIGSTNTNGYTLSAVTSTPTTVPNLALDVYKYARFQWGVGVGCDPGQYSLDVNGNFRADDGRNYISMETADRADALVGTVKSGINLFPAVTVTGTLAVTSNTKSAGYYSVQSGSNGVTVISNATTVIPLTSKSSVLSVNVFNGLTSVGYLIATYLTNSSSVVTPVTSNSSNMTGVFSVVVTSSTITLSNATSANQTFYYNITVFPVG